MASVTEKSQRECCVSYRLNLHYIQKGALKMWHLNTRRNWNIAKFYIGHLVWLFSSADISARSSLSSVVIYTRAVRSVIVTVWQPLAVRSFPVAFAIVCRNTLPVQSSPSISPTAKYILVTTVISGHHHLTLLYVIVNFEMAIAILATLKISDWLIEW